MTRPWYAHLNRYHWFVLLVAALGWLFDTMDQQLFVLARPAAMRDLVPQGADAAEFEQNIRIYGNYATSVFLAGWALGGLIFGVLGDRFGRARVMAITILMYSVFTGLSSLSRGFVDFALYRFLAGLGVGGEFAVGVALVAEVMPAEARPRTLALLQALSTVGNITAALINLGLGLAVEQGLVNSPWRIMFLVGSIPALLAVVIRRRLKEPEQWQRASQEDVAGAHLGSYADLFRDPVLRKHALLGLVLACSGVIGLWAVGFFVPDLMGSIQRSRVTSNVLHEMLVDAEQSGDTDQANHLTTIANFPTPSADESPAITEVRRLVEARVGGRLARVRSYTAIVTFLGGFVGMYGFGALAERIGRKRSFVVALLAAYFSTAAVFYFLEEFWQLFVLVPLMGFCQFSLFAGYAIYLPELFPTRLRSTGTSFCYNVGRFVAAIGPLIQARLIQAFASSENSLRSAGLIMCTVFLVGLVALPFLPETKDRPLPE